MVAINKNLTPRCDATKRRGRGGRCVENGNIPNGTTDSLWQGWQTMEERNPFGGSGSTDTPIKQYVWGTYIDECIQLNLLVAAGPQSLPAGAYYLLQDLLYRAVALTNSSGAIVEAYDCDAYGNTLIFTGPGTDGVWFTDDDVQSNYGANGIIYCGYRFDPETQNYYARNRNYSPSLGRWITRDPVGHSGGINVYEYVREKPAVATDPKGKDPYGFGVPSGTAIAIGYNGPSPAAIERAIELDVLHSVDNFFRKLFRQSPVSAGLCVKAGPCKAAINAGAGSGLSGSISYSNGPISGGVSYHFQSGRITPTAGISAGPAGLNQSGTLTFLIPTGAKAVYVIVGVNLPMECRAIARNPPGYVTDVNGDLQVVPP